MRPSRDKVERIQTAPLSDTGGRGGLQSLTGRNAADPRVGEKQTTRCVTLARCRLKPDRASSSGVFSGSPTQQIAAMACFGQNTGSGEMLFTNRRNRRLSTLLSGTLFSTSLGTGDTGMLLLL